MTSPAATVRARARELGFDDYETAPIAELQRDIAEDRITMLASKLQTDSLDTARVVETCQEIIAIAREAGFAPPCQVLRLV